MSPSTASPESSASAMTFAPKEALSAELLAEGQSAEELEQNELLVDAVLKAQEWRYLKKDTSPASTTAEWRCFLGAGGTALCLNTPG